MSPAAPMEGTSPSRPPPPSSSAGSSSTEAAAMGSDARRFDRRQCNQLRPPLCELGPLNRADGSARFAMGETSVLAAVYGPGPPRYSRKERIEGAAIEVTLHPHRGQATSADREKEAQVKALLEEAVLTERHPRTMVHVVLQALGDDGGVLACALNAAVLAAMDAGLDMRCLPLSIPLAIMRPRVLARTAAFPSSTTRTRTRTRTTTTAAAGDNAGEEEEEGEGPASGEGSVLLLDPTTAEEKAAAATLTMTLDSREWRLLACHALGPMAPPQLFAALEAAASGAQALLAFVRVGVEAHARRTAKDDA